jgi:hypothetical protein
VAGPRKLSDEQRLRMLELRRKVDLILDRLANRLPLEDLEQLREFSFVGEWSLAADNLMATLVKKNIPVTVSEKDALRDLLYSFRQPDPGNRYIASRDEVLASLRVSDQGEQ